MRKLIIDACGPEWAKRYFICDGEHNFWNDTHAVWVQKLKDATLWSDIGEASKKQRELMMSQIPGELQTFAAPIFIDVKAGEEINVDALKLWLTEAVQVWINSNCGTGPVEDSMVMMHLDWDSLMNKEDLDNAK